MKTIRICGQCGTPLPPEAPEGLCPKCLIQAGIGTESGAAQRSGEKHMDAPSPEILAKQFPQLEIIELLGQGGMGTVYKARQPQLDRFVALKILSAELSREPAFAERFTREARALARLNHPNIVAVYDFGKAGDHYYFVMEYVDGMNLYELEAAKRRLDPEQALAIVPKICDALQYAHEEGIVHRDIKPGNILIDKKGRVKIADFGLAKLIGKAADVTLTQSRAILGTPLYMAPEQLAEPQKVDHRADIYSLGVVFYEMLTGDLPMGRFAPPSQKAQIDVRLDEVVLRALEREPERRYQHVSEVKTDIEGISSHVPGSKNQPAFTSGIKIPKWLWVAGGGALLAVVGAIALVVHWFGMSYSPIPPEVPNLGEIRHASHPSIPSTGAARLLKSFSEADNPISSEMTPVPNGGWMASCTSTQTFKLFEVPDIKAGGNAITYRSQLKTEVLKGRAYLEMWCRIPGKGEFFSRGLENTVTGTTDWATYETSFFLDAQNKPDLLRLNVVVEGAGKIFVKNVQVSSR